MNIQFESERLSYRPIEVYDAEALFELDKNPNVHLYLGNHPVTSIDEVLGYINSIQQQYIDNGIGRFAAVLKETNEVIGWTGIKFITEPENNHVNFYDLGYRLQEKHWRKGYALEAAKAWLDYGFNEMNIQKMYASAHVENVGSNTILQRIGMKQNGQFYYEDLLCNWYELENNNTN
jgi:[ribosomal protein S5]-alanine N-acetyltransferase